MTFALVGAGKLGNVQVDAGATEYSVTFDANSTVEKKSGEDRALSATTSLGNKVGCYVWGDSDSLATFTSNNYRFDEIRLYSDKTFSFPAGINQYASITGIKVNYTAAGSYPVKFGSDRGEGDIKNGVRFNWNGIQATSPIYTPSSKQFTSNLSRFPYAAIH